MKNVLTILLLAVLTQAGSAQVIKFVLKDSKTNKPIEGVEVFSHEVHNKIVYSSKTGLVKFDVKNTDTLVFFKRNYSPFYLQVNHKNFDSTNHLVHLTMSENKKITENKLPMKFNQLEKNQFDFVDDSLAENQIQITRFEVPESDPRKDRSFRLVEIHLDDKATRNKPYSIKKP